MRLTLALMAALLSASILAGCVGPTDSDTLAPGGVVQPRRSTHVLDSAIEPSDFTAPIFERLGAVARAGPVYGGGEPSIWAHMDGTTYLAFPGCDNGPYYLVSIPGSAPCRHGLIYRSTDDGRTWERLNRDSDGRLPGDEEAPIANGDADVAVDAAGTVYASNLGGGIPVMRSDDAGATWRFIGDVVPEEHWADRQWMAAAGPGHLIMTWMGGADRSQRAVAVNTTFDGGDTWTGVEYLGADIGWLGTVQFSPDAAHAYVPFTQSGRLTGTTGQDSEYDMLVAHTADGGITWEVIDTGARIPAPVQGTHWSGSLMAPALDVTGDGTVIAAWAEDVPAPVAGTTSTGARIRYVASTDNGTTWGAPVVVPTRTTAIMPWVTGGAGDRFAITFFESLAPLDSDYVGGSWDVSAVYVDDAAGDAKFVHTIIDERVHAGGICARGGLCMLTGSDRALLDFFESDLLPDGRLILTYPADPVEGGKYIEIRTAVQSGGSFLLSR